MTDQPSTDRTAQGPFMPIPEMSAEKMARAAEKVTRSIYGNIAADVTATLSVANFRKVVLYAIELGAAEGTNDPMSGEELDAAVAEGVEMGKTMAADIITALNKAFGVAAGGRREKS